MVHNCLEGREIQESEHGYFGNTHSDALDEAEHLQLPGRAIVLGGRRCIRCRYTSISYFILIVLVG